MDGNLDVAYDIDVNFVTAWNQMFVDNDMVNPSTGKLDPRHLYGTSNFDVFRWPSLESGVQRSLLANFVISLVMPGIPLVCDFYFYSGPHFSPFISITMARNKISTFTTTGLRTIFTGKLNVF
jgi:hypothetical protein